MNFRAAATFSPPCDMNRCARRRPNNSARCSPLLGETIPDMSIFQDALDFSEFGNMQKLEAAGVFDSKILQARDIRDPESFKVRRGKIGGYEDYLSAEDRQYATDALRELDPHFGYELPRRASD